MGRICHSEWTHACSILQKARDEILTPCVPLQWCILESSPWALLVLLGAWVMDYRTLELILSLFYVPLLRVFVHLFCSWHFISGIWYGSFQLLALSFHSKPLNGTNSDQIPDGWRQASYYLLDWEIFKFPFFPRAFKGKSYRKAAEGCRVAFGLEIQGSVAHFTSATTSCR